MIERDFYQVLGIGRSASAGEIRAAYIRLVKHHHPDVVGQFPNRLHDVQQAYRCLSNPGARAGHDQEIARYERAHLARQRAVRRRLGRYDNRSLQKRPVPRRRRGRSLLLAAAGLALVVRVSFALFH